MTSDETENEQNKEKGKKGSGRFTGTGAMGQTRVPISPAFFDTMKRFGASMEQINQILRDWKHLKLADLVNVLKEFADTARASAHLAVQFSRDAGFALVTDFLVRLSGKEPSIALTSQPAFQPR